MGTLTTVCTTAAAAAGHRRSVSAISTRSAVSTIYRDERTGCTAQCVGQDDHNSTACLTPSAIAAATAKGLATSTAIRACTAPSKLATIARQQSLKVSICTLREAGGSGTTATTTSTGAIRERNVSASASAGRSNSAGTAAALSSTAATTATSNTRGSARLPAATSASRTTVTDPTNGARARWRGTPGTTGAAATLCGRGTPTLVFGKTDGG